MGAACSLPTPEMPAHLSSAHVWWAPGPFCPPRPSPVQRDAGWCTCPRARTQEGPPEPGAVAEQPSQAGEARPRGRVIPADPPDPGPPMDPAGASFLWTPVAALRRGGLPSSPRPAVPRAGCSTVADPQLYEPKCLSRNRSEEVVCDKKIICQSCNNKGGLVGSLMV